MRRQDTEADTAPLVAVLMATFNGADNLVGQLDSYVTQDRQPDMILISDDGSSDGTAEVLKGFAEAHPELQVELFQGPQRGAAQNFLSLLQWVPERIDVVALSDQDDVWLPDKLARGVARLETSPGPALYCARTWDCDADLTRRKLSSDRGGCVGFRHALVQNIAGGNTMMLNRAGWQLVAAASHEAGPIVVHDWWIYQVLTGVGGTVIYDHDPVLLYRQHKGNMIGANRGIRARTRRIRALLRGQFREWNAINVAALQASAHRFTAANRALLNAFAEGRRAALPRRLHMLYETGIYRQGLFGRLTLYLVALLGRL